MDHSAPSEGSKLVPIAMEPAASYDEMKETQVAMAREVSPAAFKVRAQLLDQGRTDTVLGCTDNLTLRLKVYASGGENALHAHANEDHIFILLQGRAEFFDTEGRLAELGALEGIVLPKGCFYRFNATSSEPLVMLRVGSPNEAAMGLEGRVDVHGGLQHADSDANKTMPTIFKENQFFG